MRVKEKSDKLNEWNLEVIQGMKKKKKKTKNKAKQMKTLN